ncbi:hypothetical protein EYC84_009775 [Monilinia fructicola]|uniref:BZIP domain-containing protein n=1 Tax=Monilinia fructicola TaxID=38448 RepID=A0A5M9JE46_MONFR|nr:hypothetical protein EYC84_009775 [Monilinia fructicola]
MQIFTLFSTIDASNQQLHPRVIGPVKNYTTMSVTATTTAGTARHSTSGFNDLQLSPCWDHNSTQLFHEYDLGFDVNAQCSATSDTLFPVDAFTLPASQSPFQNSPDWWLPQTDPSFEFITWNDPSIGEDVSIDSSFPIAAGASLGNDNFIGQSDVGSIDSMPQSHSFLDNQTHRAIPTDQSSPPSPNPKATTSQTQSSPPSPPSPNIETPKSSSTTMSRVEKRKLNTLAARRYRQKRVDQMSSLEAALKEVERRDGYTEVIVEEEGLGWLDSFCVEFGGLIIAT